MLMQKLQRFLYGRYGTDSFNLALLVLGIVCSCFGALFFRPLYFLTDIVLIYALFRALSKNIPARQRENQAFLKVWLPAKGWLRFQKQKLSQRKEYKYFKCPHCRQQLRAPKRRGKIEVTCQRCRSVFQTKT